MTEEENKTMWHKPKLPIMTEDEELTLRYLQPIVNNYAGHPHW